MTHPLSRTALAIALLTALPAQKAKPAESPQVKAMNELYKELLDVVRREKVNPRQDDLRAIQTKRQAVSKALDEFTKRAKALMFDRRYLGLDYVRFAENTFPRLRGPVLKVGPNETFTDLQAAVEQIRPGDVVLLGEGKFQLPKTREGWRDVAFVGLGPDKTTLTGVFKKADRVRVTGVKVDCQNTEFVSLRDGSMQIQKCRIENYNSGAGGSNSLFAAGANLLIEDCTFEGLSGRQAASGSGGDAFDLRGSNFVYIRNCDFVDNDEILRANSFAVFDRCRSMSRNRRASGILMYPDGFLLLRENRCKLRGDASGEFQYSTDDREVVRYLMDRASKLDGETKQAVAALGLRENPRYWATLLHHPDSEIQFIAQGRLGSLLRRAMPKFRADKATLSQLPRDMRKPFAAALRSSEALRWLEKHEPKLIWNPKLRAYKLEK